MLQVLNDFLPLHALFGFNADMITAWCVLFTIVLFTTYTRLLVNRTGQIVRGIDAWIAKSEENFEEPDVDSLKQIWFDYTANFIPLGTTFKSHFSAANYFNEEELLYRTNKFAIIGSVPSLLVGLGILGTFIGLSAGISNFDTSSTDNITGSIQLLLGGMGTAFVTSIWGMLLSLVFTGVEKYRMDKLGKAIDRLCVRLDRLFLIRNRDLQVLEEDLMRRILSEQLSIVNDQGDNVKLVNLVRDMGIEAKEQTLALKSFSTDLADLIIDGFHSIINNEDEGLLREIKVLQSKIEELGAQIQSPATDMANQIVSNLQDALKEMMTDLNGATRKELEEIGRLLNASSGSLTQFPKHMEAVLASVQLIADEIKTATGNAVTEMSKELGVINERQVNLVDSQSDIMEKTTVLLDRFDNTVNSLQEFTLENRDSIVELREFHAQFVASGTSVEGASRSLADNLQNLQNAQKLLAENISQLSANTKESLQQMSESFETVEAKLDKQNTNFVQITNSLDNVFRQINNGLRDYQATVQSTMENFLKTYSEALTDTAKALNGTAGLQRDTISEIQEVVSILKDKDAQ